MIGVVAAGATARDDLQARGIERVPLIKVGGETILSKVCRCLLTGADLEKVIVMAPDEVPLPDDERIVRGKYSGHIVEDVIACAKANCPGEDFLLSSADMPLITDQAVRELAEIGRVRNVDLIYPVVKKQIIEERFPDGKRTYLTLKEGKFTGSNIFWINAKWMEEHESLLIELFKNRKNIVALMRTFGLGFFLKVLFGLGDIAYLEEYLGNVVDAKLHAAQLKNIELAVDLDKAQDLDCFAAYVDPM